MNIIHIDGYCFGNGTPQSLIRGMVLRTRLSEGGFKYYVV